MSQDNRLMPMPSVERPLDRPLSDIGQLRSYGPAASEPSQIRDYLHVVLKRKWLILSLCLVVTSLVAIQMFRQPSIYEAVTTIRIEPRKQSVLQTRDFVLNAQPDANFWGTQIKLLESPSLARQVALTLDLQSNPNFFGGQAQGGIFAAFKRMVAGDQKKRSAASPAVGTGLSVVGEAQMKDNRLSPEELAALEPYEDAIIAGESVEGIVSTNLFRIKYVHTDPEMAQKVSNTIAEVFRSNNIERFSATSSKAGEILENEIRAQQDKIRQETDALFAFAKETGLPPIADPTLDVEGQRLADLSRQALAAQDRRQTAQAVYESASENKDVMTVPEVQKSERVGALQDRLSALEERLATLRTTYTDEWPENKKVIVAINRIKEEIKAEANEAVGSLKAQYEASIQNRSE